MARYEDRDRDGGAYGGGGGHDRYDKDRGGPGGGGGDRDGPYNRGRPLHRRTTTPLSRSWSAHVLIRGYSDRTCYGLRYVCFEMDVETPNELEGSDA